VVSFRSFDTSCSVPTRCGVEVADTILKQGQGMHGSFSRADTWNFMALFGPDFKEGFEDPAPASNADVQPTLVEVLKLARHDTGSLKGRVLEETLRDGGKSVPEFQSGLLTSEPDKTTGRQTVVAMQRVGDTRYFDAGGFREQTLGLPGPDGVPIAPPPPLCAH